MIDGHTRHAVRLAVVFAVFTGLVVVSGPPLPVRASYAPITGSGSAFAANAIDAARVNVQQFGITVDYTPTGSSAGRRDFMNGVVDFAASDIPFQPQPEDASAPENPRPGSYTYIPAAAGGTAFVYNLRINGQPVTNLRLSGENIAKIFTGVITEWNDPAIQADNPGLTMPARAIVPVVRSDGAGTTAQFTKWMIDRQPSIWSSYCTRSGRSPACGQTSFYPIISGMIAQNGDLGVAGYISQGFADGAIGYASYSYALGSQLPAVKMLNAAGYYTEPTPENVSVSLLQATVNTDANDPATYLTQNLDGVYTDTDPRNYQLSSYSYLIVPTIVGGVFNTNKGETLGAFAYYLMCQAQQQSASLGYAPLPINLVEAAFEQIRNIPGVVVQDIDIAKCNNPTFSPDGTNLIALNAPMPQTCDHLGAAQCSSGTGGLKNVSTDTAGPRYRDDATMAPPSGNSATPFTLTPSGTSATCPGDTATDGYLWQTFITPATTDPLSLTYSNAGPVGPAFTSPLFTAGGTPVSNQNTAPQTGERVDIPTFDFAAFGPGAVPVGDYRVGLACTLNGHTESTWSARITITSNPAGGPSEFDYEPTPAVIIQDITVGRPAGALVLTQRCRAYGPLPVDPADPGFPGYPLALPAAAASADQVGVGPTQGPNGTGGADPQFSAYPNPPTVTYPTHCAIDLGTAQFVTDGAFAGSYFATSGRLNQVTVLDNRASDSGWTLSGTMSDFSDGGSSFSGNYLGWDPVVTDATGSTPTYTQLVSPGSPVAPGSGVNTGTGLANSHTLAHADGGQGLGIAVMDARIELLVPVSARTGTYTGVLTLSLV